MSALRAEFAKLLTLPASWLALAVAVGIPGGITVITALTSTPGVDTGFAELALGVAGAIVLGVTVISSEYVSEGEESAGSRQITTTLTAVPRRLRLITAKAATVSIGSGLLAIIAIVVTFGLNALLLGTNAPALDADHLGRIMGVIIYWALVGLLAFGLTIITRNGIIPMAILIANFSAVPVTFLLTRITPAANYLPDMAGLRMFSRALDTGVEITPVAGALIMLAWIVALQLVAFAVFRRRDA